MEQQGLTMNSADVGYVKALSDLYFSEGELITALGEMARATTNPNMAIAFNQHMEETRTQQKRLEGVLIRLNEGAAPAQPAESALHSLIEEARTAMQYPEPTPEKDQMLLGIARRVEQQEIVLYQQILEAAESAKDADTVTVLRASLHEEVDTDAKLAHLERDMMPRQPGQKAVESK
jgi:ferritin-like metal-binding protein YciE